MYAYEPSKPKTRRGWIFWLGGLSLLIIAAIPAYLYGPLLYYGMSGDAILRAERRIERFEEEMNGGARSPRQLLVSLDEIGRMVDIAERTNPAVADVQYLQGLLAFYEFLLRLDLSGNTLWQLTGRGFLPPARAVDLPEKSLVQLGKRISVRMRKALALDPDLAAAAEANLAIAYGDLFFTGRTDPQLMNRVARIQAGPVRPFLRPHQDWIILALLALSGRAGELEAALPPTEQATEADEEQVPRLALSPGLRTLILCHGYYASRNYLQSLNLARRLKFDQTQPRHLRVEATRMEGEIFLIQRSPDAAAYFFREAYEMSEQTDDFVRNRLRTVTPGEPE
ncbi:MAG: hypothetical protein H7A21_19090 [Spirochaetales bacterium]|nr:hypothetical protein [Leptospiraceae bacterium]MCP5483551.1 hypothetical protein [Spirochaetales bacterium]MCP5486878.1 hypothetical protein [Spirochaetales bacterium]